MKLDGTEKRLLVGMEPAGVERKDKTYDQGRAGDTRGTETTSEAEEVTLEIRVDSFL